MAYNDGKAPVFKEISPWGSNPGGPSSFVGSGKGSPVMARPKAMVGGVSAPKPYGGGMFKAHGCVPRKGAM